MATSLSAFSRVITRELRYLGSDKGDRFLVLWLPPLLALLVWWIFAASQPQQLPVAVLNQDKHALSRNLIQLLDAMPGIRLETQISDPAQAIPLLQQRKVYAVLILPDSFSANLSRGQSTDVILQHNAQFASHSAQIVRAIQTAVSAFGSGIAIDRLNRVGQYDAAAIAAIMPIQLIASPLYHDIPGYDTFLAATLIPALLNILAMLAAVSCIGRELRDGSARNWLETAEGSVLTAISAKLLLYLVLFFCWGIGYIVLFSYVAGSPVKGSLVLLLLSLLLMLSAAMAIGLLIVALTRNFRMALSVSGFYTAPAFAFSGQAFPLVAMPAFAQYWATILPLTHWLDFYNQLWLAGAPVIFMKGPLIVLLLMTILPFAAGYYLLQRHGFTPENWGGR